MPRRTKIDQKSYELLEYNFRYLPDRLELWDWIDSIFKNVIDEIKPKDYNKNENAEFYKLYKQICEQSKKIDIDRLLYLKTRQIRNTTIGWLFSSFRSSFFMRNPKIYHVFRVSTDSLKYLYKSLHGMSRSPQLKNNARDFMQNHWNIDIDTLKEFDRVTKNEKEKSDSIINFIKTGEPIKRKTLEANFPKDIQLIEKMNRIEKIAVVLIDHIQHYVTKKNIDRHYKSKYKLIELDKNPERKYHNESFQESSERLEIGKSEEDKKNLTRPKHRPYLIKRETSDETKYYQITEEIKPEDFEDFGKIKVPPRDREKVETFIKSLKTKK